VLDAVDRGLAAAEETGARMWLPELHRLRAEALSALGHEADAAEELMLAASSAREMGAVQLFRRAEASRIG
jgi:predicted ATPase